jgi:hypothetical protein
MVWKNEANQGSSFLKKQTVEPLWNRVKNRILLERVKKIFPVPSECAEFFSRRIPPLGGEWDRAVV